MAFDLTPTSATYGGSGTFGQQSTGGKFLLAAASTPIPSTPVYTIEMRLKTASAGIKVAFGQAGQCWIGVNGAGNLEINYGSGGTAVSMLGTTLNNNTTQHIELSIGPVCYLFQDGVAVDGNATSGASAGCANGSDMEVRNFVTTFDWSGEIDELAIWDHQKHTSGFTPPSAPYVGNESGLLALYHFDGDGLNSAGGGGGLPIPVVMNQYRQRWRG